jgi:hypothetical protein
VTRRERWGRALAVGAVALTLAGGLAAGRVLAGPARPEQTAGLPRSPAIYPEQTITLRFSHRQHAEQEIGCLQCHRAARTSRATRDRLVPGHTECGTCHDIEAAKAGEKTDPPAACQVCHPGFDWTVHPAPRSSVFPSAAIDFSHEKHLGLGAKCEDCHFGVERLDLATRGELPKMANCLVCHEGKRAPNACGTCHLEALGVKGGRLETELPSGRLVPMAGNPFGLYHGPRFEHEHALLALGRRDQCAACHAQTFCDRCHDGTTKPQSVHPNDWISLHPVSARQDEPRCDACHRRQTFCTACHERLGIGNNIGPGASGFRDPTADVHPPGWLISGPGHHGVQASRNISQCASCHREEQCLQCHATTTEIIKPHPPGFRDNCRSMLRKNERACVKCHSPANPGSLDLCR